MSIQLTEEIRREYIRLATRIKTHGNPDTVMKRGRKPVTDEHKKETYKLWKEKIAQEKIAHGIPIRKKGRPKKSESVINTSSGSSGGSSSD
jgi:hypothetical protein